MYHYIREAMSFTVLIYCILRESHANWAAADIMYLAHPSCNGDRGALAAPHIELRKLIKFNKTSGNFDFY